jgi:hypothetical protein
MNDSRETFRIVCRDKFDNLCEGSTEVSVVLSAVSGACATAPKAEAPAVPRVKNNRDGTYSVNYFVHHTGTYEVDVRANNKPINGSPFMLRVVPNKQISSQQQLFKLMPMIGIEIAHHADGYKGVKVKSTRKGKAADVAGITEQHYVQKVCGVFIETNMVFQDQIQHRTPGDILPFVVLNSKDGKVSTKNVEVQTLGKTVEEVREIRKSAGVINDIWDRKLHSTLLDSNSAMSVGESPRPPAFWGDVSARRGDSSVKPSAPAKIQRSATMAEKRSSSMVGPVSGRSANYARSSERLAATSSQLAQAAVTAKKPVLNSAGSGRAVPRPHSANLGGSSGVSRPTTSVRPLKSFEDKTTTSKRVYPQNTG